MDDFINIVFTILFWICLLSPVLLIVGFFTFLLGKFLQRHSEFVHSATLIGKKMMIFSSLAFMVGFGACLGVVQFYNPFLHLAPTKSLEKTP